MKTIGIITARGGSKRLPNKNIADLGGKPLIAWTIEASLAACDRTVVTTDSAEIADVALRFGAHVVDRPAHLAQDTTPSLPVVAHASASFPEYDTVALLQPTSPFRTADDIKAALRIFDETDCHSVVSMVRFRDEDSLFWMTIDGRAMPVHPAYPALYIPNGAIYIARSTWLMHGTDWYTDPMQPYIMPTERSLDIDTRADLDAAQAMLGQVTHNA